jgi:hypothetical protein
MRCEQHGIATICGPDVIDATVTGASGKTYRFDFDEMFGPLVLAKNGKPLATQPSERHEFWPAFEAWHDARRGLPPKCTACRGERLVDAVQLSKRSAIAVTCPACDGKGRASPAPVIGGEESER